MVLVARIASTVTVAAALCGCIERSTPTPPARLTAVTVVVANESRKPRFIESPVKLVRSLTAALRKQGLEPQFVEPHLFEAAMREQRSTQARLRTLAKNVGMARAPDDFLLLVETDSRFYSELEGRFRWTVEVKASLARRSATDSAVETSFSAPAILVFPHQGGNEALSYVAEPMADQVGRLAREFVDEQVAK